MPSGKDGSGIDDILNQGMDKWIQTHKSMPALMHKMVYAPDELTVLEINVIGMITNTDPDETFKMINDRWPDYLKTDLMVQAFPDLIHLMDQKEG